MKNIIFIAPPAAGKGTQSDLLVKKYGYIHISTGDLLRNEVRCGTELGKSIDEVIKNGALVSDEIVTELLRKRLSSNDITNGFILDGYPRNVAQAITLDNLLQELNIQTPKAIYLEMDETLAMHRALGRVTCPKCNRGYNKYEDAVKPKIGGLCDDCGEALTSRSDDTEETFKIRYESYIKSTLPLLKYYEDLGILSIVDNSGTPESTFIKIEEVI